MSGCALPSCDGGLFPFSRCFEKYQATRGLRHDCVIVLCSQQCGRTWHFLATRHTQHVTIVAPTKTPLTAVISCPLRPPPLLKQASTPQLTLKSFEMGVMFLPSLLGRSSRASGESGDDGDAESLAFTCTPGEVGLTQRFPLSLLYECEPEKALPLDLLPLPYVLPGEIYIPFGGGFGVDSHVSHVLFTTYS